MRRREFGRGVLGIAGLLAAGTASGESPLGAATSEAGAVQSDGIDRMLFPSTGGLLDETMEPLTDDSLVAVWAEPTAEINDRDDDGDAVDYPDDVDIPIVGIDEVGSGTVAAIGSQLVDDGNLVPELAGEDPLGDLGNEEFLLNLYDEYAGDGTILWDEGHGQFYTLDQFQNFAAYVEDNGYTVEVTSDLPADLDGASAVVITSPSDAFSDDELAALSQFVDDGGLVVMHNQSDFNNFDETGNFNQIADDLGVGFRFNDAEVGDTENNVGIYYLPLTGNFNDDFPLFEDRPGIQIDLQRGREYDVTVESVADGDTVDVRFDGEDIGLETDFTGTVRILGIDTPESASVAASAERPEEWEGLAYEAGDVDPVDELVFDSTASLLDANGEPLTDDSLPVVYAESSAFNVDEDGNGDAVSYPDDADIPLVAVDGGVAGLGAPFVAEGFDSTADNEEFLLNLYGDLVDGDTVLWDESHGQFYDLASFPEFESYAEEEGYDLQATGDLEGDLGGADAVVITSPSDAFTDSELSALSDFVDNGGAVILHDQSDFNDFDATANLNEVADALDLGFRFNDDQVLDEDENAGAPFVPTTGNFDGSSSLFETRSGIDDDPDARTTEYLIQWANNATDFANRLDGEEVTLFFDDSEPLRDPTRLLAYIRYDDSGDGQRDTLYNKQIIEEGYGRAYGSSLSRHDEFWQAEWDARQAGTGIWTESDIDDASPYRDDGLEEVFAPVAASIGTAGNGSPQPDSVLFAEPTADRDGNPQTGRIPLFGRDEDARTVVGGSLLVDERYERLEGFEADTAGYDNFQVVTENIESLTDKDGPVFVDGGHGQFGASYALSSEDMAYYQRHLEGRGVNLEQLNDLTLDRLSMAQALIITTPATALTQAELDAVTQFRDDGGAVVLMGSAAAPDDAIDNLNGVAAALGTDLRVNTDQVVDAERNVADDPELPATHGINMVRRYTDGNGNLDIGDVQQAFQDYQNDLVELRLVQELFLLSQRNN
ncbi:ABC transporter [Halobacteriales archaeon SW_7_65_23]|nr:MAG: ABC transporter [Halobacteriales archaeon SW_7_65_23]